MSITKLFADDTNEKILLATITSSKSALNKAMLLNLDDIYYEKNRLVFGAIQELYREGKPVDMTTVSNRMSQDNTFEKVGGHSYISEIVKTGTTIFIESCIDNIIENSKKRKIKDLATDTIEKIGTSLSEDVSEDIERAIREINRNRSNEFFYGRDLRNVDLDVWRQDEHHISTGYVDLDGLLTGFYESQLIVIGARPGVGKSAFVLNIARRVSEKYGPVFYYSLEMPFRELVWRLASLESRVDIQRLRSGHIDDKEKSLVIHAVKKLAELIPQLLINDHCYTISEIVRSTRLASEHTKPALIVVDYLQLISGGKGEKRYEQIGNISRSLKLLAMQLRVPIIALSQLNRASEAHAAPRLSDLRESGDIEQDSDVVLFIHTNEDMGNEHSIIVAKNRNGIASKRVGLIFQKNIMRFDNMSRDFFQ